MEVAGDLRHDLFYAEELVGKEIVDLDGLVLEQALDARVGIVVHVVHARTQDDLVQTRVREFG